MSAFCDIWIGSEHTGKKPVSLRTEHTSWTQQQMPGFSYWQSTTNNASAYLQEAQAGQHHLLILGQFYEAIDTLELLAHCRDFVQGSCKVFHDPAGHYILFLFDKEHKELTVFTNRLGTYHAYYTTQKGSCSIGTYFLGLAQQADNKKLDWAGITGFLGMGFFPSDTTYLEDIRIFNPASCYHFNAQLELQRQKRYWDWTHTPGILGAQEAVEQLHDVLHASVDHAVKGKRTALPISGGLDSRQLAGVLTTGGNAEKDIWGYSYGYVKDSVETRIANKIALAKKIPFNSYVLPNYLFEKIDLISDSVDLFQYVDGTRQASMKELLEERSDLVIGGHWGDVWMDDMGICSGKFTGSRGEQLDKAFERKVIKKGSNWLFGEITDRHFAGGKDYLKEYFRSYIRQYDHIEDADFAFKIFKTDQWSFRWTLASICMYQAAVFPVLPFYDRRIADLFTKVASDVLVGRSLQIEYLKKYHPDLARITWQEYGRNLYQYKGFNNRSLAYRVADKLQRTIKGQKPIQRNWEVFYLNDKGRKELEKVFLSQTAFNEIVPAGKCKALLDDFYRDPSAAHGYSISMLHTLARFIEKIS